MEDLTNERVVESWLPLLDKRHLQAAVVRSFCEDRDWCPSEQIVLFPPVSQCQFCMNQALIGELGEFSGATVFAVQSVVHSRANVEFWLKIADVGETNVHTVGLEKGLCI